VCVTVLLTLYGGGGSRLCSEEGVGVPGSPEEGVGEAGSSSESEFSNERSSSSARRPRSASGNAARLTGRETESQFVLRRSQSSAFLKKTPYWSKISTTLIMSQRTLDFGKRPLEDTKHPRLFKLLWFVPEILFVHGETFWF